MIGMLQKLVTLNDLELHEGRFCVLCFINDVITKMNQLDITYGLDCPLTGLHVCRYSRSYSEDGQLCWTVACSGDPPTFLLFIFL